MRFLAAIGSPLLLDECHYFAVEELGLAGGFCGDEGYCVFDGRQFDGNEFVSCESAYAAISIAELLPSDPLGLLHTPQIVETDYPIVQATPNTDDEPTPFIHAIWMDELNQDLEMILEMFSESAPRVLAKQPQSELLRELRSKLVFLDGQINVPPALIDQVRSSSSVLNFFFAVTDTTERILLMPDAHKGYIQGMIPYLHMLAEMDFLLSINRETFWAKHLDLVLTVSQYSPGYIPTDMFTGWRFAFLISSGPYWRKNVSEQPLLPINPYRGNRPFECPKEMSLPSCVIELMVEIVVFDRLGNAQRYPEAAANLASLLYLINVHRDTWEGDLAKESLRMFLKKTNPVVVERLWNLMDYRHKTLLIFLCGKDIVSRSKRVDLMLASIKVSSTPVATIPLLPRCTEGIVPFLEALGSISVFLSSQSVNRLLRPVDIYVCLGEMFAVMQRGDLMLGLVHKRGAGRFLGIWMKNSDFRHKEVDFTEFFFRSEIVRRGFYDILPYGQAQILL